MEKIKTRKYWNRQKGKRVRFSGGVGSIWHGREGTVDNVLPCNRGEDIDGNPYVFVWWDTVQGSKYPNHNLGSVLEVIK